MNIKLITVTSHPELAENLIKSATKHGWDLEVIKVDWKGFGTKLIATYEYLKAHPEVEQFVFADAFDVVVLGTPQEFEEKIPNINKIWLSTEKGLWPPILEPYRKLYVSPFTDFKFVNSGCYYSPSKRFIDLFDTFEPKQETDDQFWFNLAYLFSTYGKHQYFNSIGIDENQMLFNSHSHMAEGEYGYENNRVQILGNEPIFIHFNGKTIDLIFNERIKI